MGQAMSYPAFCTRLIDLEEGPAERLPARRLGSMFCIGRMSCRRSGKVGCPHGRKTPG